MTRYSDMSVRRITRWLYRTFVLWWAGLFFSHTLIAQCTDGNQPECTCLTAPVLCTIDELDDYMFSMTNYQHPWDGPSPLCPPQQGTVTNNPTWFAFVAWCTSLTLFVDISNCTPFQFGINGVQIAIYSDCNPYTPVACNTSASDCNTNDKTLSMNNLVIGNTYYFLIDGCAGAYCDVSIDVVGTCGEATIDPWTDVVGGPTEICAGSSETHTAEDLHGATDFHWYIDGVLVEEGNELTDFTQVWGTAGTFELCVDASNVPCIPESDPPDPNCITVMVFDANAGTIQATPTPVCPNDVVMISATGFNTTPGYHEYIVIVDASGIIVQVVSGAATTFTHDECASFTAYSYNYHDAGGMNPPNVGDPVTSINCGDGCCDTDTAPFEFIDDVDPVFGNPPGDLVLSCFNLLPPMPNLNWTDNCDGSGNVAGTESGFADLCDGGVITREWEYTDLCGNTVEHLQMISIAVMPEADFVNPPVDITVDCANIPASAPTLIAMNTGTGGCAISAMVTPQQNGTADECGGGFTFTWEYTDVCDRTITHTQNVTVTPLSPPIFDMIVEDTTVECDAIPTTAPDLNYSNGDTGPCAITGSVPAMMSGSADLCGGNVRFQWDFTDQCGRSISATQNITVNPVAEAMLINPPADITLDCNAIPGSFPSLNYSNGELGSCLISGSVTPIVDTNVDACGGTITVTWQFNDPCNRSQQYSQVITVTPAPPPTWINPPGDTMIDCSMLPTSIPDLSYSNGESGVCAIAGSVPGVQTVLDVCQGIVTWEWQYSDLCGNTITHARNITTTQPPPVIFNNPPADITVTCLTVPSSIPSLTYTNNATGPCLVSGTVAGTESGGGLFICGGMLIRNWEVVDPCGVIYSHQQTITVLPTPPAMFLNPPADVTIECDSVPAAPPNLLYSNGMPQGPCAQVGSAPATVTGSYNSCGGNLVYTWEAEDFCGEHLMHTQNVTVLPAPVATFDTDTIPPFLTISCNAAAAIPLELPFSNGASGLCAFEGTDSATVSGDMIGPCGGTIFLEWSVVDSCNNTISFTHGVNFLPAAAPQWVDPPANDTLGCFEEYLPPEDLLLTNGLTNECEHTVWVTPEVIFENNVHTHIWSYLSCNTTLIEYIQYVYDFPEPEIEIDPVNITVCYGDVFDLASVVVTEASGDSVTITYHTSSPPTQGNQLGSSLWTALDDEDFVFLATNSSGCTDEAVFEISVLPLPNAGDDEQQAICTTEGAVDFTDYLSFDADPGGYWIDLDGAGVLLDNPSNISFAFVDPGTYHFQYVVAINACPADTSVLTIILSGGPSFTIDSVYCTDANMAYTVIISGENLGVTVSAGTIVTIPGGLMIEDIPIDQQLTFDIWDTNLFCVISFSVNAPNCECPQVPAPTNLGDVQICLGDPNPPLAVSVNAGLTANWYSVPVGGTALATGTTIYVPTETLPGIYTYYVEGESLEIPGCVSTVRTPVIFEITPLPNVNNLNLDFCDTTETGSVSIDLFDWAISISSNLQNTITFHSSMGDAESGSNTLVMPVFAGVGTTDYFARVVNLDGCVAIAMVEVMVHPLPGFNLQVTHETCLGDANGAVLLSSIDLSQQYTIDFNGTMYTDVFQFSGLSSGMYDLTITNTITGCTKEVEFTINAGIQPLIANPVLTCHDNDTDTDPADDYYTLDVVVNSSGATLIYELIANGVSQGYHTYGQTSTIQLPANGATTTLIAIDTTVGCSDTLVTSLLNSCSSDCDITVDAFTQICNDNGTPADTTDDFHTITLNVTAINGDPSNQYGVYLGGVLTYLFNYGMPEFFNLPVSGPPPAIQLQDIGDSQCFFNLNPGPLTHCSNACILTANVLEVYCDNNGTNQTAADDIFYVIVHVDGTNIASGAWSIVGQPTTGTLGVPDTIGPYLISGGNQNLVFSAVGDNCTDAILASAPATCSMCAQTIDAGPDMLLDCGTPSVVLTVTSSDPGTASWIDPGGGTTQSPTINVSIAGQYIATVSFFDGCVLNDTVIVTTDPALPAVWGGLDQYLNCEIKEVLLNAEVLVGSGAVTYEWTNANGDVISISQSILISMTGTYFVRIYDPVVNCWSGKDEVVVFDISNQPSAIIYANPGNVLSCVIASIILTHESEMNVLYTWMSQGLAYADNSLTIYESGAVTLVALDTITKCASKDSILIQELTEYPFIQIDPPLPLSCGTTSVVLDASGSIPSSGGNFIWTNAAGDTLGTDDMLSVQSAGTFILELNDPNNGCVSFDTVLVADISQFPEIDPADDLILPCDNEDGQLNVSLVTPLPGVDIQWSTSGGQIIGSTTGSQIMFNGPGVYIVNVTHALSQCSDADTILISETTDGPDVILSTVTPANCDDVSDGMIVLSSVQGGTPPYTFFVNGLLTPAPTISNLSPGTYLVQVEDVNGCALDTVLSVLSGEEVMVDLEAQVTIQLGEDHLLMAVVNIPPSEISSVFWTPGTYLSCDTCLSTQSMPEADITYTIVVTDIYGCTGTATVTIRVIDENQIFIPNAISPSNRDNVNDYFTVYASKPGTHILSLRIFDRWGAVVFEKKDFPTNIANEGWDGTFNGEPLNPAVFVYMVEVESIPGVIELLKGDVTIVR